MIGVNVGIFQDDSGPMATQWDLSFRWLQASDRSGTKVFRINNNLSNPFTPLFLSALPLLSFPNYFVFCSFYVLGPGQLEKVHSGRWVIILHNYFCEKIVLLGNVMYYK